MVHEPAQTGTVVEMSRFGRSPGYPALRQVEAYWTALLDGRTVPDRADIDPRGLEDALDVTFVAERIAAGVARMRIAGHHFSDLLGMEARGMTLNAFFDPAAKADMAGAVDACCDQPAQVQIMLRAKGEMGRPEILGQVLLLPLRSDMGETSRILGVIGTTGQIGRTPRRFEIEGISVTELGGGTGIRPAIPRPAPRPEAAAGFAEPGAAFDHAGETRLRPSKVPHLRVVDDE